MENSEALGKATAVAVFPSTLVWEKFRLDVDARKTLWMKSLRNSSVVCVSEETRRKSNERKKRWSAWPWLMPNSWVYPTTYYLKSKESVMIGTRNWESLNRKFESNKLWWTTGCSTCVSFVLSSHLPTGYHYETAQCTGINDDWSDWSRLKLCKYYVVCVTGWFYHQINLQVIT